MKTALFIAFAILTQLLGLPAYSQVTVVEMPEDKMISKVDKKSELQEEKPLSPADFENKKFDSDKIKSLIELDEKKFSEMHISKMGGDVSGGAGGKGNAFFNYTDYFSRNDVDSILNFQKKLNGISLFHSSSYEGSGQTVMIIDSGIESSTKHLKQIKAFKDFTDSCPASSICDGHSHGTFVADIILQMAPKANLVLAKVLDESGKGSMKNVIKALKWGISNHKRYQINIVNMSLINNQSLLGYFNEGDEILRLIKKAASKGIHVVVNSGNNAERDIQNVIAASPDALTVGSYDHYFSSDGSVYKESLFSNSGSVNMPKTKHTKVSFLFESTNRTVGNRIQKPDILAPGSMILGHLENGSLLHEKSKELSAFQKEGKISPNLISFLDSSEQIYLNFQAGREAILLNHSERLFTENLAFMSGTTISAAMVSGSIATLQSAIGNIPPKSLKDLLINSTSMIHNIQSHKSLGSLNLTGLSKLKKIEAK
jgi:subtilisin family serine protease